MLAYVFLLAAATPDKKEAVPEPTLTRALSQDEASYRCIDGSMAANPARCPAVAPPPTPPPRMAMPSMTRSRPAKPRSNPGLWVSTMDYPARSLRMEEEGTTAFRLEVGVDGRVVGCVINGSSGSAALDLATCSNITRRARFEPALDSDGNPALGYYSNRVRWQIPSGPSFALQIDFVPNGPQPTFGTYTEIAEAEYPLEALQKGTRGATEVALTISSLGVVTNCAVVSGSGSALLDERSCEIAYLWKFLPARDAAGFAAGGESTHRFKWTLPDAWKRLDPIPVVPKPLL
jgi:periplasmic protein TonB